MITLVDDRGEQLSVLPSKEESQETLRKLLRFIVAIDPSMNDIPPDSHTSPNELYELRNTLVEYSVCLAKQCGYKAGFSVHQPVQDLMETCDMSEVHDPIHPDAITISKIARPAKWDIRWGVVAYIKLPTGQVSWHLDSEGFIWDSSDNRAKSTRINQFVNLNA